MDTIPNGLLRDEAVWEREKLLGLPYLGACLAITEGRSAGTK
jgi:hypothetical protein